jgi:hypothetical protein
LEGKYSLSLYPAPTPLPAVGTGRRLAAIKLTSLAQVL